MPEPLHLYGSFPVQRHFPRPPPVKSSVIRPLLLLGAIHTKIFRIVSSSLTQKKKKNEPVLKLHFPWTTFGTTCVNSGFTRSILQNGISHEREIVQKLNKKDKREEEEIEKTYLVHDKRSDSWEKRGERTKDMEDSQMTAQQAKRSGAKVIH